MPKTILNFIEDSAEITVQPSLPDSKVFLNSFSEIPHDILKKFVPTQDYAFSTNKDYYFSADIGDGKKCFYGTDNLDETLDLFESCPVNQRHFYCMATAEICEMIEIDGYDDDEIFIGKSIDDIMNDFEFVHKKWNSLGIYNNKCSDIGYYWENSSGVVKGRNKISLHCTIRTGGVFENNGVDQKAYQSEFRAFVAENNYQIKWDKSVYSANRHWRLGGSSKIDSSRILVPVGEKSDRKLYIPTYFTGNEFIIERTDKAPMNAGATIIKKDKKSEMDKTLENKQIVKDGKLNKLIDLILEQIETGNHSLCDDEIENRMCYDDWKKLAFAIIRITEGDCYQEFRAIFEYYRNCDDYNCETMYAQMRKYTSYGWTVSSLHYWARENPKYETAFLKESLLQKYDSLKKKFQAEIELTENADYDCFYQINNFISREKVSSLKAIEKCLRQTIFEIQNAGKCSFVIKVIDFDAVLNRDMEKFVLNIKEIACLKKKVRVINDDFKNQLDLYFTTLENKKVTPRPSFTKEIYIDYNNYKVPSILRNMYEHNEITNVQNVVNEPYLWESPTHLKNKFNIFRGFELMKNNKYIDNKSSTFEDSLIFNHWKKYLMPTKTALEYCLNYFAHMIQKPSELPRAGILFFSNQGTGKDLTLAEFLATLVGWNYYVNFGDITDFFGHFTADQEGKLLTVINEIAEGGAENIMFKKSNVMKDKITRKLAKIEYKGFDPVWRKHTSRYLLFTNHKFGMPLDASDRRFFPIHCKNDMANNKEYFAPILKELGDPDFFKSAFAYFAYRNIEGFNPSDIPSSKYKDDMKQLSMPHSMRFLMEMFDEFGLDDVFAVQVPDLFQLFSIYCKKTNCRPCMRKTFVEQIEPVLKQSPRRKYNVRDLVVGGTIRKIHNILRTPYDEPNIDSNSYIFPIDKEILLNNITHHLHIAHSV